MYMSAFLHDAEKKGMEDGIKKGMAEGLESGRKQGLDFRLRKLFS